MKRASLALVISSLAALVLSCIGLREGNPEHPAPVVEERPPPFGADDLHALMWKMAASVGRINAIMRRGENRPISDAEQTEVVLLLGRIEAVADRLSAGDARVLHPVLGRHIDDFRKDVAIARRHAAAEPPNFFMAGTIAGACANCHGEGFDKLGMRREP